MIMRRLYAYALAVGLTIIVALPAAAETQKGPTIPPCPRGMLTEDCLIDRMVTLSATMPADYDGRWENAATLVSYVARSGIPDRWGARSKAEEGLKTAKGKDLVALRIGLAWSDVVLKKPEKEESVALALKAFKKFTAKGPPDEVAGLCLDVYDVRRDVFKEWSAFDKPCRDIVDKIVASPRKDEFLDLDRVTGLVLATTIGHKKADAVLRQSILDVLNPLRNTLEQPTEKIPPDDRAILGLVYAVNLSPVGYSIAMSEDYEKGMQILDASTRMHQRVAQTMSESTKGEVKELYALRILNLAMGMDAANVKGKPQEAQLFVRDLVAVGYDVEQATGIRISALEAACAGIYDSRMRLPDVGAPPLNKDANKAQAAPGSLAGNSNDSALTKAEKDAVRAHVEKFWNVPDGAGDGDKLVIYVRVSVLPDGTVTDAQIQMGDPAMMMNPYYQATALSARRAVRASSPLPIPTDKYDQFKDFTLSFNPKFAAKK